MNKEVYRNVKQQRKRSRVYKAHKVNARGEHYGVYLRGRYNKLFKRYSGEQPERNAD
jgi:hypothetical protein